MDIIWAEEAINSFEETFEALVDRSPQGGVRFADVVISAVDRLSLFPESGQIVPEHQNRRLRQVRVGQYRLIYRLSLEGLPVEALLRLGIPLSK